jgi:hypothetical protein
MKLPCIKVIFFFISFVLHSEIGGKGFLSTYSTHDPAAGSQ